MVKFEKRKPIRKKPNDKDNQILLSRNWPKQSPSVFVQFQMESNHCEIKLHFQTSLFSPFTDKYQGK